MTYALARRAAPKPGPAARKPATRANAALPAYLKGGVGVVKPDAPAEKEAESVARTVAGGGTAFGAGRGGDGAFARAPQLPAKPEEKKKEEPVKKAGKAEAPAGPEKKDEPVKKAGKAEAPAGPEKKDEPVKKAAQPEKEKKPEPVKRAEKAPGAEGVEDKMKMPVARLARDDAGPDVDERPAPEEEPVARKGDRESEAAAPQEEPSLALAAAAAAPGRPLAEDTRGVLEQRLGADLGHVRVHDDRAAQDAAEALDARAYTQGADVYLGRGESDRDVELIAHEVTHVLQNDAAPAAPGLAGGGEAGDAGGAEAAAPVMREKKKGGGAAAAPGGGATVDAEAGTFEKPGVGKLTAKPKNKGRVEMEKLRVPEFKRAAFDGWKKPFTVRGAGESRDTAQRAAWDGAIAGGGLGKKLEAFLPADKAVEVDGKKSWFAKKPDGNVLVGRVEDMQKGLTRPQWNKKGKKKDMHVDHKVEWQVGGDDTLTNLWLLEATANTSAGAGLKGYIDTSVTQLVDEARDQMAGKVPTAKQVLAGYTITFAGLDEANLAVKGYDADNAWERGDVEGGAHLPHLKVLGPGPERNRLLGDKDKRIYVVYARADGGWAIPVQLNKGGSAAGDALAAINLRNFEPTSLTVDENGGGTVQGTAFKKKKSKLIGEAPFSFSLSPNPAVAYGGFVDRESVRKSIAKLDFKPLCAFDLADVELGDGGIDAIGTIKPEVPFLKNGLTLAAGLRGGEPFMSATIDGGSIDLPKPFAITGSSLTLGVDAEGFSVTGGVFFTVEGLGEGSIEGQGRADGVSVKGNFAFDSSLFTPAEIGIEYKDDEWSASGKLGIGEGKIKGIKSASIAVSMADKKLKFDGAAEVSVPGVEGGKLGAEFDDNGAFAMTGELTLKSFPGVEGGKLNASVKKSEAGAWSVAASGDLTPKIPGIATKLHAEYKDGTFLGDAKLAFAKGRLAGDFRLVVTNGAVPGAEGGGAAPAGGAGGGDTLSVWGRGSATLKITDWLQGKATLILDPGGKVKVEGEISTPGAIELWKGKSFDHEIFKLGVDIPILGFSVAGQRVGVFANITGGAGIHASIGPVQLKDAKLGVAYDFDTDTVTSVSGHALIDCPAEAGLNLFIRAGIGVGAPIISAQGGLKASADVGVKGGISQELTVDWTPQAGLKIETEAKAVMKPTLTLTLSGFCLVEADLLVKTITLYEQEWKLAGFEVGSDLEFGIKFPIKYEEGKAFDISLDDVKFITPDISGDKLAKSAMDAVV